MQTPFIDLRLPTKDAWGKQKFSLDKSLFSSVFTFDIPSRKWIIYEDDVEVANSASTKATSVDHEGYFQSDGGKVLATSRRHPRYQPNRGYYYGGAGMVDYQDRDCYIRWGAATAENGYFFELYRGTVYAVRRALGVDYKDEFPLHPDADLTKGFLFDIQAQMRQVGDAEFYLTTSVGTMIYHMGNLNRLTKLALPNPQLMAMFEVEAVTEDNGFRIGCIDVSAEGGGEVTLQYVAASFVDSTISALGDVVAALRQPELIGSYMNTRDAKLVRITMSSDKKSTYNVYITRDATAITTTNGDADWTSTNSGSYIEKVDTGEITAYDTAKMELLTTRTIQAGETSEITNPDPSTIEFFLVHGDYIVVEGIGSTAVCTVTIELGDEQ